VPSTSELYWLAGLLDGEGCFLVNVYTPRLALAMTDVDTVERAATLMGAKIGKPWVLKSGKPYWNFALYGTRAIEWMQTLYVLMSVRRQAAIRRCLKQWRANRNYKRKAKLRETPLQSAA
jgi:hypothetical protein